MIDYLDTEDAALIAGIDRSHPLVDGNERLSWDCAVVFALRNGRTLAAPQGEINAVIRSVAEGGMDPGTVEEWVTGHQSPVHLGRTAP